MVLDKRYKLNIKNIIGFREIFMLVLLFVTIYSNEFSKNKNIRTMLFGAEYDDTFCWQE